MSGCALFMPWERHGIPTIKGWDLYVRLDMILFYILYITNI